MTTEIPEAATEEKQKPATYHDSGYKRLFSNKTIFRQLIETFVEEDWVPRLDFEQAERLETSFVSEHYKETEADIIYKVPIRNSDKVMYLCLLIEFQSSVLRFMSVRSLQYTCDFYMDFILSNKGTRGLMLPAMFPLVLYNGDDKWTAPDNIDELIEKEVDLGKYGLHFEHFVIAENEFGKESLLKIGNIVATLFLAEAHYDRQMMLDQWTYLCETENDQQALLIFLNWFRQLAVHGQISTSDFEQIEGQYKAQEGMKRMLIKALERERQQIREELRPELLEEIRPVLLEELKPALREEMRPALLEELKPALREEMRPALLEELKPALREEMRPVLLEELKPEIYREVYDEIQQDIYESVKQEVYDNIKQESIDERNRQIARAMFDNQLTIPVIAQLLKLSLEEVEHLLAQPSPSSAFLQTQQPEHKEVSPG